MDKILKLLEIAKKFGVKPSKVIGTQGNVVPYKKPSLVDISVDEFKLKESIDKGTLTMDKVQQEMEETVRLALSKNLNDVELNRALNNAINIDRQFFPPMAEVVEAGSKQQVTGKGLEELIQKEGLTASPKTPLGQIQLRGKRLEQEAKDLSKEFDIGTLIKGAGRDQLSEIRLHNEGLVRAVTRQILSEDIKAGKIKSLTLDDLGTSREPIDYFRKIYGENALEQLDSLTADFNRLNTEQEAASLARSKFKFEPDETRTKGSISYDELEKNIQGSEQPKESKVLDITTEGNKRKSIDDLIDEYNANQDRLRLSDEEGGTAINYDEFNDLKKKNEDIAKALEEKGISSAIEEEVKPEGIVIPFRKKFTKPEPEGKAQGGIIGYAMGGNVERQGYGIGSIVGSLSNMVKAVTNPAGGLMIQLDRPLQPGDPVGSYYIPPGDGSGFRAIMTAIPQQSKTISTSEIPLTVQERYNKYLSASGSGTGDELYKSYRANLDKKADGGRIGFAGGKSKAVLDLIAKANKKLKGKKSMESINPKTGEVTVPKKPIRRAEEPTGITTMDSEPEIVDEKLVSKPKKKTTQRYDQDIIKAADEIFPSYDDPKIAADQIVDSYAQMKFGLEDQYGLSNKQRMDLYTQAYDYVMDYNRGIIGKTAGESINISDPKTAEAFTNFAKENDPEGFAKVSKVVDRLNELSDLRSGQEIFETYDLETYNYLTSGKISQLLNQLKNPYKILDNERDKVRMGFTSENFEGTGLKNLDEINFRADKKQLETYLEDLYNKKQVEEAQTELFNLQDSGREPNAKGGPAGGLDYLMGF